MNSFSMVTIAKWYAHQYGPLKDDRLELKTAVEGMLHRFTTVLLQRHKSESQFPHLCGLLWSCSVLAWPAPHLATIVARDVHCLSSGSEHIPEAPSSSSVNEQECSAHALPDAFLHQPPKTAAQQPAKEEKTDIGLGEQRNLLSWALDKTSSKIGGMLWSSLGMRSSHRHGKLARLLHRTQLMGPPTPRSITRARPSAELQPWVVLLEAKKGELPGEAISSLRVDRQKWEKVFASGSTSLKQESSWSGMNDINDLLGSKDSSSLLKNLSSLSATQLRRTHPAPGKQQSSAIAQSSNLVRHLQCMLEEERKAKASQQAGQAFSSDNYKRQMRQLWPASESPFAKRLAWFDESSDGNSRADSSKLAFGGGLKQLPRSLVKELSQVLACTGSGFSLLYM